MMKPIAVLSVLASAVFAQSSTGTGSAPTPTPTSSPFIPPSISDRCTQFLETLNADAEVAACVKPITDVTARFGPYGNASATHTVDEITTALNSLCAQSTLSCLDTTLRPRLAAFTKACPAELTGTSPNADVVRQYDVLYVLKPMKDAVCSKDDSGKYCVTQISSGSPSGQPGSKLVEQAKEFDFSSLYSKIEENQPLHRRQQRVVVNVTEAIAPNTTTFSNSNVPFLFLTPSTDASRLCTTCTRVVLTAFMAFEQLVPYLLGIPQSPLMKGQQPLYQAVIGTCGPEFLSGAVQAAGGLANGNPSFGGISAGSRVAVDAVSVFGTLFAAVAAGFAAML